MLGLAILRRAYHAKKNPDRATEFLHLASQRFEKALSRDPENVTAHFNLSKIHARLGNHEKARRHAELHEKYKPDDNARDRAINIHKSQNPAADHASESIVIYDLQREGSYGNPIKTER